MRMGFTNLAVAATVTASSSDSNYPTANIKEHARRWNPGRMTVATDSWWLVDFGSATTIGLIQLVRANFATMRVQGNATDTWGAPSYNQLLTITQNPFNRQWQLAHVPVGFTFRYLRIFLPTQTLVEAPLTQFSLGGLLATAGVVAPTGFSVDVDHTVKRSFRDERPDSDAWMERSYLGNALVRMTLKRKARFTHSTPYVAGDEATTWMLNVDGPAEDADVFGLYEDLGNSNMSWVVRVLDRETPWVVDQAFPGVVDAGAWALEEVVR